MRKIVWLVVLGISLCSNAQAFLIVDVFREINGDDSLAGFREFHQSSILDRNVQFRPEISFVNPESFTGAGDTITVDGVPDALSFWVEGGSPFFDNYSFIFTAPPNENLSLRKYENVSRDNLFPQFRNGPGFAFGSSGHSDQTQFGEFELLNFTYSNPVGNSFQIDSLGLTFEMNSGSDDRLYGNVFYNFNPSETNVVPEPATLVLFSAGLFGAFVRRKVRK